MDPKGHTEAITEIVQEGLPGVPGKRLQIFFQRNYIKGQNSFILKFIIVIQCI